MQLPPHIDEPDSARRLKADPQAFLARCHQRYGPVFTVTVEEEKRITYVLDPHAFLPLLTAPEVDFSPASRQSKARFGLGKVVRTEKDVRALSTDFIRALRGKALAEALSVFGSRMEHELQDFVTSVGDGRRVAVQDLVHKTLMPATTCALFGEGVYDTEFTEDFLTFSTSVSTRFAGSDPSLADSGVRAEQALMERLRPVLDNAATPALERLKLGVLARPELNEAERLRTLLMLMWGSMVNLIPTSVWMYSTLIRDPELVASVRANPENLIPSIVEETLRLFSRPNMYRQVTKDFALTLSTGAQVRLSAGDWVALFPRFLHHDPTVFRDALSFDARRFCPVNGAKARFVKDGKPLKHPTVVFGLGRGRCPGDTFALSVLAVALKGWVQALEARSESTPLPEAVRQTVASTPGPAAAIYAWLKPAGHQEYSP